MVEATVADQFKSWTKDHKTIAVVAGDGKLPGILAKSAKERGYKVVALPITKEAYINLEPIADVNILCAPGQILRTFNHMKEHGCNGVVFIGKVRKMTMLKQIAKFDWMAIRELFALPNLSDDSIQFRLGYLLEERGMRVLPQSQFLRELFPEVGVLTKRQPTAEEYVDIDYGMRIAKEIARLDIGQTVVVRGRILLAVEAAEGTDEAIKRGVQLAKKSVVVCKVSKPNQDQRFDIPAVGIRTLNAMGCPGGGGVLAIEANETMVVDGKDEMVAHAEKKGICVVAV